MNWKITILTLITGALLGAAGWAVYAKKDCNLYKLVNHDYACGEEHVISKADYVSLKHDILDLIDHSTALGGISYGAMYFRDLHAGPAFGINESNKFIPASLLKLPVVMAYFSYEEEFPGIVDQKIRYSPEAVSYVGMLEQVEHPDSTLKIGEFYTIEEMMRNALVYSDNLAFYLILDHFTRTVPDGSERMLRAFHELGILDPRDPSEEAISVRNYSGLFRQLYNISYLTPEHSEQVLTWLSESVYDKALEAGVPTDVLVAHKFGERDLSEGEKQLHDCGIVYFPNNPYVLCVMTRGSNWQSMAEFIRTVSKMVYEEVESRRF